MAISGPSLAFRIFADTSHAITSVHAAAGSYKTAGAGMKDAFSPAINQLNRTGLFDPFHDAMQGVSDSIETVKNHANDLPVAFIAVGSAVAGVGASLQVLGSKDKAAHQQLQAAVEATGKSWDDYEKPVEKAIKSQEKYGHTATDTQDALQRLTEATHDPGKALHYLAIASDMAAAKHESLAKAASVVGRAYNGSARALKEFGIIATNSREGQIALTKAESEAKTAAKESEAAHKKLAITQFELGGKTKLTKAEQIRLMEAHGAVAKAATDSKKAHDDLTAAQANMRLTSEKNKKALEELGTRLKGQASASADTFKGHLDALRAHLEDQIAVWGTKYGPALQNGGLALAGVGAAAKGVTAAMDGLKKLDALDKLKKGAEGVGHAMTATKNIAVGTFQGISKAAKIGAEGIKGATQAVKDLQIGQKLQAAATKTATAIQWAFNAAMDANPIMLVVIAVAAVIAIIVILIIKVKAVRDFFKELAHVAKEVWDKIVAAVKAAFNWIKQHWPLLLAILAGPFGLAMLAIIKNRDKIWDAIKAVWSWIKSAWHLIYDWVIKPYVDAYNTIRRLMDEIWHAIKAVWDWISSNWHRIFDWISRPFQDAVNAVKGAMNGVFNGVKAVWDWIARSFHSVYDWITRPFDDAASAVRRSWDAVSSFFAGIPGKIKGYFSGAIGWLTNVGHDIIQGIINGITSMGGAVGDAVHGLLSHLPGAGLLHKAHIPGFQHGGFVPTDQIAFLHAGEYVIPAARVRELRDAMKMLTAQTTVPTMASQYASKSTTASAPTARATSAIHIENMNVSTELDVEAAMRRMAWIASTQLARTSG
jgi:hypothetical protein